MRKSLIAGALAVAATVGLATPAFAINSAACWPDNGQLAIKYVPFYDPETQCYVNAGEVTTSLPGAFWLRAGNNDGWVDIRWKDGQVYRSTFYRGNSYNYSDSDIIRVHIN